MRSIRMLSAFSARQRSSVRLVMRLYLIPASGLNSNVVTTGPGLICVICPCTSNSAYFSVSTCASNFSSSASTACCSSGRCSKLLEGSLYPPAILRHRGLGFVIDVGALRDFGIYQRFPQRVKIPTEFRRLRHALGSVSARLSHHALDAGSPRLPARPRSSCVPRAWRAATGSTVS